MIGKVKEELEKHIGEEVFIQYHLGRNKYESYQCVIRELYNNVFLVEMKENEGLPVKSFSYTDISSFTIPQSVTSITGSAFEGADIKQIKIHPDNHNFIIQNDALYDSKIERLIYYTRLSTNPLEMPNSVKEIGASALMYSSCPSVKFSNKLQIINSYSFYSSLVTSITIPSSQTSSSILHLLYHKSQR